MTVFMWFHQFAMCMVGVNNAVYTSAVRDEAFQ